MTPTYLLFCMYYAKYISLIEFFMDFCIYGDIYVCYNTEYNKLLKLGWSLYVDKSGFLSPGHIYN